MEKVKKEGLIIIALLLVVAAIIMMKPLNDLDEIWNFNFAKNIAEGKLPYKDFNMITTPAVPLISSIFLKIFGSELIVMRILAVILCTAILYMVYKILEYLKVNKHLNFIFLAFLSYIFISHFRIDYNFFVLLNILIIIYIELKDGRDRNIILNVSKKDIILGILAGICVCSKQTTGLVVTAVVIFNKLLYVADFKEFKLFLKKSIIRMIGVLIPLVSLAIYFLANSLLNDFINYCILGISTFSNSKTYINLFVETNWIIKILCVIVPVFLIVSTIIYLINKYKKKEYNSYLLTVLVYSLASMIVVFPIADDIHFLVGALPSFIGIIYVIYEFIKKKVKNEEQSKFIKSNTKTCSYLIIAVGCIVSGISLFNYLTLAGNYTYFSHYKYIIQEEKLENSIKAVNEYMQNQDKEVYMLDPASATYTIPLDKYTKNYDMLLIGNLGKDGENGIIQDLQNKENCIILIRNDEYERNWQNPEKVREYVIENMNKIGQISVFDIYEN